MKTRSNMPLFVVECEDITKLTDGQIDLLRCGDYLVKKTGNQQHAYKVTYKEDKQGICLTYHDASCIETVSYDYTGEHWVYNSSDKALLPIKDGDVYEFNGDVNVNGKLTGDEIVENMTGYSFSGSSATTANFTYAYSGIVKNGNKLTMVIAGTMQMLSEVGVGSSINLGSFYIPNLVATKLYPYTQGSLDNVLQQDKMICPKVGTTLTYIEALLFSRKFEREITFIAFPQGTAFESGSSYNFRIEVTFLLSDNLVSE